MRPIAFFLSLWGMLPIRVAVARPFHFSMSKTPDCRLEADSFPRWAWAAGRILLGRIGPLP
jgi:hypothetical protein